MKRHAHAPGLDLRMSAVHTAAPVELRGALPPLDRACRASVIIPARNEGATLPDCLNALRLQTQCDGAALHPGQFEVLLLLNNCQDESAALATHYAQLHPAMRLHVLTCRLEAELAHAGSARSLLMNLACARLEALPGDATCGILSTDADTQVAPDWIARNLEELDQGADAVGGYIHLHAHDVSTLDAGTRAAYVRDRLYQECVAHLESLLDPVPADPWPRHRDHFGASLACTPAMYRRAGGLPPVRALEDVAFVHALRRAGARLRHSPETHVYTSGRLEGRVQVGLSAQLRTWQQMSARGLPQMVESCEWLEHCFRAAAAMRRSADQDQPCEAQLEESFAALHGAPARYAEIESVLSRLRAAIAQAQAAPAPQVESADVARYARSSTPDS